VKIQFHEDDVYIKQFELVESRFHLLFLEPDEFFRVLGEGARFANIVHIDEKIALARQNFFSLELFEALICGGSSYKTGPINYIWRHLKEAQIFLDSLGSRQGIFVDHTLNIAALKIHLNLDTFQNILRPPSTLASRYRNAIVAVDVRNSDGDNNRGTGFIVAWGGQQFVLTCKHNVDEETGIALQSLTTAAGTVLNHGTPRFFGKVDLCAYTLDQPVDGPVFRLSDMVEMFDDVYTLGYPRVPGAHSDVLGHKGELNGNADMFLDGSSLMIISNLISPGSSGCPVLLSSGLCVGMSIRWLEGRYGADGDERARFSAALPSSLLISLLSQE
jgi:Trypsin-like peptidase domain